MESEALWLFPARPHHQLLDRGLSELLVGAREQLATRRVDDALYGRAEAHFSREELVRLTMTIALAGMVNRVHAAFRTLLDDRPGN